MLKKLLLTAAFISSSYGSDTVTQTPECDVQVGKFLEIRSINFGSLGSATNGAAPETSVLTRLPESRLVKTTTTIGFKGNLISRSYQSSSASFLKQKVIFVHGAPHSLAFKFTRLPDGEESVNKVRYEIIITVRDGTVKRNNASGLPFDTKNGGASLTVTFDANGHLQRFDSGQPTESNIPPELYIELPSSSSPSITIKWDVGKESNDGQEKHLTAYDGSSGITDEWSEEENTLNFNTLNRIHY